MSDFAKDEIQFEEAGWGVTKKLENEQILLLAVIDRALQDAHTIKPVGVSSYINPLTYKNLVTLNAREWLASTDYRPLSFLWCCEMLDMDPQQILTRPYRRRKFNSGNRRQIKRGDRRSQCP